MVLKMFMPCKIVRLCGFKEDASIPYLKFFEIFQNGVAQSMKKFANLL